MIDITKRGTKLPILNGRFNVSCSYWKVNNFEQKMFIDRQFFVHGVTNRHNVTCLLVEKENYLSDNYYEIAINDIKELIGDVYGYKSPTDFTFGSQIVAKDSIFFLNKENGLYHDSKFLFELPKEIVETWEAIYEKPSEIFTVNDIQIDIKEKGIYVGEFKINVNDVRLLIQPLTKTIERTHSGKSLDGMASDPYRVTLVDATYQIGCTKFKLSELIEILRIYDSLQK